MHRNGALLWRGNAKRVRSAVARLVLPDDEVVAVAVGREVAVDELRLQQVVGLGLGELLAQDRADAVLELRRRSLAVFSGRNCHWLRNSAVSLMIRGDVVDGDALDDPRADERRDEHRVVGPRRRASAPGSVDGRRVARSATPARAGTVDSDGTRPSPDRRRPSPRLMLAEPVHHVQALERVLAVEQPALVDVAQIALDVRARERGAAEQHGDVRQAARVQLLEVVAHDQRALHEQAAHADGVGLDLDGLRRSCR